MERIKRDQDELRERKDNVPSSEPTGCNPFYAFWKKGGRDPMPPPSSFEPVPFALSAKDAAEIRHLLGEALQARLEQAQQGDYANPTRGEDAGKDVR